jgi:hypothetical protein
VQKFGLTYPNIVDPDGQVQLLFGDSLPPQAIPSTVIIDRDGNLVGGGYGRIDLQSTEFRNYIKALAAKKAG